MPANVYMPCFPMYELNEFPFETVVGKITVQRFFGQRNVTVTLWEPFLNSWFAKNDFYSGRRCILAVFNCVRIYCNIYGC